MALTPAQQRQVLEKIADVHELVERSRLQNILSDFCFPRCIKKVYKRSDEIHAGEIYCIERCLWRMTYVHEKAKDFYKAHPIPDVDAEVNQLESDLKEYYKDVSPNYASWRAMATAGRKMDEERRKQMLDAFNTSGNSVNDSENNLSETTSHDGTSLEALHTESPNNVSDISDSEGASNSTSFALASNLTNFSNDSFESSKSDSRESL